MPRAAADVLILAIDLLLLASGGAAVATADDGFGRAVGLCAIGGAVGGGIGFLLSFREAAQGRSGKGGVRDLALRSVANMLGAVVGGLVFGYKMHAWPWCADLPQPVHFLLASMVSGLFFVTLYLMAMRFVRSLSVRDLLSWITTFPSRKPPP